METIELRIRLNFLHPLSPADQQTIVDKTYELVETEADGGAFSVEDNEVSDFEIEHERVDA